MAMENPFNLVGGPFSSPTVTFGHKAGGDIEGLTSASQAAQINSGQPVTPTPGGVTATSSDVVGMSQLDLQKQQQAWEEQMLANQIRREQDQAIGQIQAVFANYNLQSLFTTIENYVRQGYSADTVAIMLRQTPEYKQRFPAMDALSAKGRAITEADYINYETTASGLERRYGLPQGMLMGNVTNLLSNEVSASELNDRVMLASAASIQAPQELKDQFQQYYGIDSGGMTAYFLDPAVATPLLEKQYASSVLGSEAARQGLIVDVNSAENLQSLGVTQDQARAGFGAVAGAKSLTQGRGDTVTQQEQIAATLGGNTEAQKSVERAVGGRLGKFQGGGEFLNQGGQNVGLGTAATR